LIVCAGAGLQGFRSRGTHRRRSRSLPDPAPSRRGGPRWAVSERRFLTRTQLGRLLGEIRPHTSRRSYCWPPQGCASQRRSLCAGAIWTSTRARRGCRYDERSSAVS
jgi:hypothetical protein